MSYATTAPARTHAILSATPAAAEVAEVAGALDETLFQLEGVTGSVIVVAGQILMSLVFTTSPLLARAEADELAALIAGIAGLEITVLAAGVSAGRLAQMAADLRRAA